jgi:hypothetical protein
MKIPHMKKTICFTIDVEPDFAGLLTKDQYCGKNYLYKLEDIVKKYNLKLTAFATAKTLEENSDILGMLQSMKAEIEQHSYSHQIGHLSKIKDIEKGIETHIKILGNSPIGYRSPQGIITKQEALFLEKMGIMFDASIFPTIFPGRFNRLNFPVVPFKIKESSLIEIPYGVVPKIRIPISLSYMQLLGLDTFKFFFRFFGLPDLIVYDFHTYELGKVASYSQLPRVAKLGYYRAQGMNRDPIDVLEGFVEYILSKGYEPKYMIDIYKEVESKVSIWNWDGD